MSKPSTTIVGIGNPIVDELSQVEPDFLKYAGGEKGGMELVDGQVLDSLSNRLTSAPKRAAGGSAGNTAFALARLGMPSSMVGKLGKDDAGEFYRERFRSRGGQPDRFLYDGEAPTGRCLCLVTPDSERTMRTHLGAAMTLTPEEIESTLFAGADHVHVEGYLLFNPDLIRKILETAHKTAKSVSLDLASFEVVEAARAELPLLLGEYVDMVFANEEEAAAFSGSDDPEAGLAALAGYCDLAVVKLGAEGALLRRGNETVRVSAEPVTNVVDTTGAGDYWAAGFLFGHFAGCDLAGAGRIGARLGAAVVQQLGAGLDDATWETLRETVLQDVQACKDGQPSDANVPKSESQEGKPQKPTLDSVPDEQQYGDNPTSVRETEHYQNEYVSGFVDKWDNLIDWDSRAKSEGSFFLDVLRQHGKRSVLDVATGTGFHSVRLIEAGFNVVSADGSPAMLAKAFHNAESRGHIMRTVQADWRYLNRDVHGEFDAIICLGNSFTHLFREKDRRKALAEYYAMLKHDGILILDQRNYDSILDEGFNSKHKYYYCGDEVTAEPEFVDEGLARFQYSFNDGSVFHLNMFPLRKNYVRRLMKEVGFQKIETFGDFQETYHEEEPDFFVHIAHKAYEEDSV